MISCAVIVSISVPSCLTTLVFCGLVTIIINMNLLIAVMAAQSKLWPFLFTVFTVRHGLFEAIQSMMCKKCFLKTKAITSYITSFVSLSKPISLDASSAGDCFLYCLLFPSVLKEDRND